MDSLYQRLKELDPDQFQRFCAQLLKERHPGQEIKHIEGAGGDEGLDVFKGDLSGKPVIWQCKAFRNGVSKSQKEQIKKSLRAALKHSPSCWILCLNVDLDTKTTRWFEKLKKSYASKVKIGQMFALDIFNELIHRRSLRNQFFPSASLDVIELKRLITRKGEMTLEELENVTEANLEDIIERRKESDPRFNYQIVFDGDLGPQKLHGPIVDGLLMSVSNGATTLNVFARDKEALRADPPTFSIQFKGTGIEKIRAALNTGMAQEFTADELGKITTDWGLLGSAAKFAGNQRLILAPSPAVTSKKRHVRVVFRHGSETVQYGLMEFSPVRIGKKEAEFSITGRHLPFILSLVTPVPAQENVQLTIKYDGVGQDIREIKKAQDALSLLRPSGELHIIDLETDRAFLSMTAELPCETPKQARYRKIVNELVTIADRFRAKLNVPDKIFKNDYETIALLKRYMQNDTAEVNDISIVLMKSEENKDSLPELLASGKGFFRFTHPHLNPAPTLFGTAIDTGPVMEEVEAEIKVLDATLESFRDAAIGAAVKMSFRPLTPVRFSLLAEGVGADRLAFKAEQT